MLGMPFWRRAPVLLTDHAAGPAAIRSCLPAFGGGQSDDFASILPVKQSILFSVF
jgi:hypothetical protein